MKDNSLVNCKFNAVDIYKYDEKKKKFIYNYSLKCINMAYKVMELANEKLAFLADFIFIYSKVNGKYVEDGKCLAITTIDDFVSINENEIASISCQESVITFWDLTTRKINAQIGDIENLGHFCMLLYDKFLIVGGYRIQCCPSYFYIINTENKELIKKYVFHCNVYFMIKLNEKEFITGESEGFMNQFRFEENELKLIDKNKYNGDETVKKLAFCRNSNHLASLSKTQFIIFKIDE